MVGGTGRASGGSEGRVEGRAWYGWGRVGLRGRGLVSMELWH